MKLLCKCNHCGHSSTPNIAVIKTEKDLADKLSNFYCSVCGSRDVFIHVPFSNPKPLYGNEELLYNAEESYFDEDEVEMREFCEQFGLNEYVHFHLMNS